MKILKSALLLLAVSANASAYQPAGGFDPTAMQATMQAMQRCMSKIDEDQIEALRQRGNAMKNEIETLCRQGKRDAAERKAIAFAREINESESLKQLRKCGEIIRSAPIPMPIMPDIKQFEAPDSKSGHICDEN